MEAMPFLLLIEKAFPGCGMDAFDLRTMRFLGTWTPRLKDGWALSWKFGEPTAAGTCKSH